jgi:hypothetical protein
VTKENKDKQRQRVQADLVQLRAGAQALHRLQEAHLRQLREVLLGTAHSEEQETF